jgi:hypothetical protein
MSDVVLECVKSNADVAVGTSGIIVGASVAGTAHLKIKIEDAVIQVKLDDVSRYWIARKT